jgi:hypothetical protein
MATSRPFSADSHCHWSAFPPDAHGASAVHGWPGGPERAPRYSSRLPSPPPAAPANGHDRDGRTATSSRFCTPVAAQPELTDLYRAAHAAGEGRSLKGGDPAAPSGTATLLRLHPPHRAHLRHLRPLRVRPATSGAPDSGGVTGGVYKAREHIHRSMLTCGY